MAQDLKAKRLNIVSKAQDAGVRLLDALRDLEDLAAERAVAGNFSQEEFDGTALAHFTPSLAGLFLESIVPRLTAAVDDESHGAKPRQILHEIRP